MTYAEQIASLRATATKLAAIVPAGPGYGRNALTILEREVAGLERLAADPRGFETARLILGGYSPVQVLRQYVPPVREGLRVDALRARSAARLAA